MFLKKMINVGPTQLIALGFLITILVGSILLKLPISHVGELSYFDSLFVATSATCITGFSTVTLVDTFTIFGQIVIMCLVQIGGLGFMLVIALILMLLSKKITLRDRILIGQTMNNNSLNGLIRLTRKILKYTFTFEIIGALFIAIDFIPEYRIWLRTF